MIHICFVFLLFLQFIPTVFFCSELIAAIRFYDKYNNRKIDNIIHSNPDKIVVAVIIPAHNEETVIGKIIDQVIMQLNNSGRLIVVADNCSDKTAAIARKKNAEVVERHDPQKRGKGYALDCGIQYLKSNPPDVVVIMDADVQMAPGLIDRITNLAHLHKRPIQAKYLLTPPDNAEYKALISAFAFLIKNYVRPLGLSCLGGGCLLTGTGMAFVWEDIVRMPLANANIVEDMQLGIELAISGSTPMYCPDALVTSEMAPNESAAMTQRTRWEHGHFRTMLTQVARLLCEGFRQKRIELVLLGLEIAVPPLTLLVLALGACFALSIGGRLLGAIPSWLPYAFGFLECAVMFSVLVGWILWGRNFLSIRHIIAIPLYAVWKIPIYIKMVVRHEKRWEKTMRN